MLQRFVNLSWSSSLSAQWHEKQIKMLSDGINLEQTKILTSVFFEITNTIKLSALENSPSWIESSWGCYWGLIEFSWPKFNLPKLFNDFRSRLKEERLKSFRSPLEILHHSAARANLQQTADEQRWEDLLHLMQTWITEKSSLSLCWWGKLFDDNSS